MGVDAGAGDRPQDVGRSHHRAGELAPETSEVLERYRAVMRLDLAELLGELRPETGQLTIAGDVERPSLEKRRALWDLAIKLGRELAGGPGDASVRDPGAVAIERTDPTLIRPARPAPRLKARERRSLGG
jgi:hypothetical protein